MEISEIKKNHRGGPQGKETGTELRFLHSPTQLLETRSLSLSLYAPEWRGEGVVLSSFLHAAMAAGIDSEGESTGLCLLSRSDWEITVVHSAFLI